MLNIAGKFLEWVICTRLEAVIQGARELEFGFRKSRSTIDATDRIMGIAFNSERNMCAIIALDLQNAFNLVRWNKVMLSIEE